MKILIAPSKTMAPFPLKTLNPPPFKEMTQTLLQRLKNYSVKDLQDLYQVNQKIAEENHQRFSDFQEIHEAYHAYTGYMFKMMEKKTLSAQEEDYIKDHLMIVSGLYGLVSMRETIALYRLPMGVKVGEALASYWKKTLTHHLQGEWVVDLLSQEYRDAFDLNQLDVTTIDFVAYKNGKEHRPAMALKKARGQMVKLMAQHTIKDREALKTLNIDGYRYDPSTSTARVWVFKKDSK